MEYENYQENLTYIQKTALEGEIALLVASSGNDAEIIYKMYLTLASVPKEFYSIVLSCFRNLCDFPEDTFIRVRNEVTLGSVPLWIWRNKCIADLRDSLKFSAQGSVELGANTKKSRLKLVESAFILFCKKVAFLHPAPVIKLCSEISEHNELEFLHTACFLIIRDLSKIASKKKLTKRLAQAIMECNFDIRELLSFAVEYNQPKRKNAKNYMNSSIIDNVCEGEIPEEFNREEEPEKPSDAIDSIESLVQAAFSSLQSTQERFIVKKVFKGSKQETVLNSFPTRIEAEKFVRQLIATCPDLNKTCSFVIEHGVLQ